MDVFGLTNEVSTGDRVVTIDQIMEHLQRSEFTIYDLVRKGRLSPAKKVNFRGDNNNQRLLKRKSMWNLEYINRWVEAYRASDDTRGWFAKYHALPTEPLRSDKVFCEPTVKHFDATYKHRWFTHNTHVFSTTSQAIDKLPLTRANEIRGLVHGTNSTVFDITTGSYALLDAMLAAYPYTKANGTYIFTVDKDNAFPFYMAMRLVSCEVVNAHAGFFDDVAPAIIAVRLHVSQTSSTPMKVSEVA